MSEHALRTRDGEHRELARTTFDRPVLLVAGAGTGKTSTLVARVVTWITGEGWARAVTRDAELRERRPTRAVATREALAQDVLARVAAITFTEAAAAEMATRIDRALSKLGEGQGDIGIEPAQLDVRGDELLARVDALRQEIDALYTGTFHAWCRRLIAAHPLEAGLAPGFTIDASGEARARAVRDAFVELLDVEDAELAEDLVVLAADGYAPSQLERFAGELLAAGATAADLDPAAFADPREGALLFERLAALAAPFRPHLAALAAIKRKNNAVQLATALAELAEWTDQEPPNGAEAWAMFAATVEGTFPENLRTTLRDWGKAKFNDGARDALGGEVAPLVAPSRELAAILDLVVANDPARAVRLARVLGWVLARFEQLETERGFLGFDQILRAADALLARRADVAETVRRQLDLLLVDEFQDTDALQCAIVGRVALEGDARPSLFLVGDPKQSIYAFRGADMAAFDAFERTLADAAGLRLELSVNFRSAPAVLAEVERTFDRAFESVPNLQPGFAPLVPKEGRVDGDPPAGAAARIEHWVAWGKTADGRFDRGEFTMARELAREGRAIAADLLRLAREDPGFSWSDAAVLLATQTAVEHVLEALRAAGIPFDVQADRDYYQRREVVDAVASVRIALDPDDHLALAALLRAPFVGVPDAGLEPLWRAGFPHRLRDAYENGELAPLDAAIAAAHAATPTDVPGLEPVRDWDARLRAVVRTLVDVHRAAREEPLDRALERLREGLGQERVEAGRYLAAWRLANLDRLWRRLLEATGTGGTDAPTLLRALRRELEVGETDNPGVPSRSTRSAVRVMTMHGSKGLEFDHVYVAQLSRERRDRGTRPLLFGAPGGAEPTSGWSLAGHSTPAYPVLHVRRRDVEAAERVRLLYVAATRAAERLVLSSGWRDARDVDWREARSLDQLQRVRPDQETVLTELEVTQAPVVDRFGARWSFLDEGADVEPWVEERTVRTGAPADALAHRLAALAERRSAAAVRARRPRTAGPSAGELASDVVAAPTDSAGSGATHADARAVGTLVHAWFEAGGATDLAALAVDVMDPTVLAEAREVLAGASALCARHAAVADRVVARELPYLAPPSGDDGPTDAEVGAIDLVLRDPDEGTWTVVDFKTDRVDDDAAVAAAIARHAPQLEAYARALAAATGAPVSKELWFLRADRVESVGTPVTHP